MIPTGNAEGNIQDKADLWKYYEINVYSLYDDILEVNNTHREPFDFPTRYMDVDFEEAPVVKEEKVEAPVVKEEPKEIAHDEDIEPCVICGEFGFKKDMIRMGDGYYDEFCYNEVTKVEEEVEATPEMIEKAVSIDNCEACGTTNIEWMSNWDYMCHDCGHCGSVN